MTALNSDHLRTFLAILEAGSVTGGAARIGRSQSATSLQIRQLETTVGSALFHRHGRGVTLTPAGDTLLPVARDVVRSLDRALAELRGDGLRGRLRVGLPDDRGRSALAQTVAGFVERHPDVQLEVHCALGAGFEPALRSGQLDLAVFDVPTPERQDHVLRDGQLVWMQSRGQDYAKSEILPVAVFGRECWWRDVALASLDAAGRRYRVVFSSESAVGVRAAVEAGIAAGLLIDDGGREGLSDVPGLPAASRSALVIRRGAAGRGRVADAMCAAIAATFGAG